MSNTNHTASGNIIRQIDKIKTYPNLLEALQFLNPMSLCFSLYKLRVVRHDKSYSEPTKAWR